MIVVADTSVLLNLCRVGEENLLWEIFGEVTAPRSVQLEFQRATEVYPRFEKLVFPRFIEVHEVIQPLSHWLPSARLDPGESDAIALTLQLGAALLLIDERKGRQAASQLGLRFSGILGILVAAKQKSLITNVRDVIERLRKEAGFFLSEAHLKQALDQVGE